ncbi:hypothetical protein IRY61_02520 [Candidatus Saccharibacteria bacterium]|jgi:hypothetical protein|nr:hypothetical protein [Candidatus Saccharibacteria bacterium]
MGMELPALSDTYLYKVHVVANALDRAFDRTLHDYANGLTLAQFLLLITVGEKKAVSLRQVARFLEISAPAAKRQADIALARGWLERDHRQVLRLTENGAGAVREGLKVLEQHLFHIFADSDQPASLMEHIDTLLAKTEGVLRGEGSGQNNDQGAK